MADDRVWMLLFVVAGLGIAVWSGYSIYEEQVQLHTAVEVEGTVLDAETVTHGGRTGGGVEPDIRYRYTYDGQTYTSDVVFPGADSDATYSRATQLVNRYENRSTITVYVVPNDPDESYLVKDTRGDLGQVAFTFIGLLMAFLPARKLLGS